jgi:RsiW-degrading membrane proteinase PrsW (M82 family)
MDGSRVALLAIAWWVGVPVIVFGIVIGLGFDWRKASGYGLTRAGPPSLGPLAFVIVGLALVVVATARPG